MLLCVEDERNCGSSAINVSVQVGPSGEPRTFANGAAYDIYRRNLLCLQLCADSRLYTAQRNERTSGIVLPSRRESTSLVRHMPTQCQTQGTARAISCGFCRSAVARLGGRVKGRVNVAGPREREEKSPGHTGSSKKNFEALPYTPHHAITDMSAKDVGGAAPATQRPGRTHTPATRRQVLWGASTLHRAADDPRRPQRPTRCVRFPPGETRRSCTRRAHIRARPPWGSFSAHTDGGSGSRGVAGRVWNFSRMKGCVPRRTECNAGVDGQQRTFICGGAFCVLTDGRGLLGDRPQRDRSRPREPVCCSSVPNPLCRSGRERKKNRPWVSRAYLKTRISRSRSGCRSFRYQLGWWGLSMRKCVRARRISAFASSFAASPALVPACSG